MVGKRFSTIFGGALVTGAIGIFFALNPGIIHYFFLAANGIETQGKVESVTYHDGDGFARNHIPYNSYTVAIESPVFASLTVQGNDNNRVHPQYPVGSTIPIVVDRAGTYGEIGPRTGLGAALILYGVIFIVILAFYLPVTRQKLRALTRRILRRTS